MKIFTAFVFLMTAAFCFAADVVLMENGSPQCVIVSAADGGATGQHAAEELSAYLGQIGGGAAPGLVAAAEPGRNAVIFSLVKDPQIAEHGFLLETTENTVQVKATKPIGLLFGAYHLLKEYGGIRWLYPGKEGEFFTRQAKIAVPSGKKLCNPSFANRTFHFCAANVDSPNLEVYDWMVRNNMNIEMDAFILKIPALANFLHARGATLRAGWHCFTRLHNGINTAKSKQECFDAYKKMFEEHPERFPLINGERRYLEGQKYQPCTTNPDNIKIIAANLVEEIRSIGMDKLGGRYIMVNNDNTSWCECENCKAAADPQESKQGLISTRYWKFINAVTAAARQEIPSLPAIGYGYQNFQTVPLGVKPDPRLPVMLSYNRKCYRHKLQDPDCKVNQLYYAYYKAWGAAAKNVSTWEEISITGTQYQPNELVFAEHLKEYLRIGINGTTPSIPPIYAKYGPRYDGTMVPNCWYGMWQTFYLAALVQWDVNTDAVKALDEANALYYGPAWENGMREYRKLLTETSLSSPGCFGWGLNAPIGRNLTRPGVEDKLLAQLARAEAAAQGNKLALAAVCRDKEFFNEVWVKQHRLYVANYREVRSYPKKGVITIDGKLEESDWNNADIVSNYMINPERKAQNQTAFRMIYEPDYLYVAMEAMEPSMNKIKSIYTERDGKIWEDNSLELFLNHPDMGSSYYHLIINDKGALQDAQFDGVKSNAAFDSQAQIAVGKYSDRWIVEMKLPTSMLGMKCFPGHTWRINSQRYRVVEGEANESSSLASGAGHNINSFLPVAFADERSVNAGGMHEKDTRFWKNSNLNELVDAGTFSEGSKWNVPGGKKPAHWHLNGNSGFLAMEPSPDNPQDFYMRLQNCAVYQLHKGKQSKFQIFMDAKGPGIVRISIYRYTRTPRGDSGSHIATETLLTATPPADQWQKLKVEYQKHSPEEVLGIVITASGSKDVFVDNVFVLPMDQAQ